KIHGWLARSNRQTLRLPLPACWFACPPSLPADWRALMHRHTLGQPRVLLALSLLMLTLPESGRAEDSLLERDVLPILTKQCLGCHGGLRQKGGLDMRTIPAMLK